MSYVARRIRRVKVKSIKWAGDRYWVVACGGCLRDWWFDSWELAMMWGDSTAKQCCKSFNDMWEAKPARRIDLWNIRTTSSGRFEEAKRSGDVFRGARRED